MERKLTPVEWFFRELENVNGYSSFYTNNYQHLDALYNEAKELEKRQIIDAFSTGTTYQIDSELEAIFNGIVYYEETFKTEEQ